MDPIIPGTLSLLELFAVGVSNTFLKQMITHIPLVDSQPSLCF